MGWGRDFSEVNFVPGTNDPFVLSSYKQARGKDYKRLTFFVIPSDDFANRNVDSDDSSEEEYANEGCLLYTSPSPRDLSTSRMPSSA